MRAFPHQVANLDRLTEALKIANQVISGYGNLDEDEFAKSLFFAKVYKPRRPVGSLIDQWKIEQSKKEQNRGSRAAARDHRYFLTMAGFLSKADGVASSDVEVTSLGSEIIAHVNADVRKEIWRGAMLTLALQPKDTDSPSYPYKTLLRLVNDFPGVETRRLFLAFEVKDDTGSEYFRISELCKLEAFNDILSATGTSAASARNAVKILPAIAEQVGDIVRQKNCVFLIPRAIVSEDGEAPAPAPTSRTLKKAGLVAPNKTGTSVSSEVIAGIPNFGPSTGKSFDLSSAIALRKRRTEQHQLLVKALAHLLSEEGFMLSENPFDCLAAHHGNLVLFEAKTLDGSPTDERSQSERALGQIKGYSHFNMPESLKRPVEIILFDKRPMLRTCEFLNSNAVFVAWRVDSGTWEWCRSNGMILPFTSQTLLGTLNEH